MVQQQIAHQHLFGAESNRNWSIANGSIPLGISQQSWGNDYQTNSRTHHSNSQRTHHMIFQQMLWKIFPAKLTIIYHKFMMGSSKQSKSMLPHFPTAPGPPAIDRCGSTLQCKHRREHSPAAARCKDRHRASAWSWWAPGKSPAGNCAKYWLWTTAGNKHKHALTKKPTERRRNACRHIHVHHICEDICARIPTWFYH